MAFSYVEAVYRLNGVSPTESAILAYLANKANGDGECWPARSTIAEATKFHSDTVKDVLRGLAERNPPLIRKDRRYFGGMERSSRLVLCFAPYVDGPVEKGSYPIKEGVYDPSGTPSLQGVVGPLEEEPSIEPSDSVARVMKEIWEETPIESRRKSTSKPELLRALAAAKKRGHDLARIREALRRYFLDPDHLRDNCRGMKGVHRVVENDRWEPWDPGADWTPGEARPVRDDGEPVVTDEYRAEIKLRQKRGRVEDWRRNPFTWKRDWGPAPNEAGCYIEPEILSEFGIGG